MLPHKRKQAAETGKKFSSLYAANVQQCHVTSLIDVCWCLQLLVALLLSLCPAKTKRNIIHADAKLRNDTPAVVHFMQTLCVVYGCNILYSDIRDYVNSSDGARRGRNKHRK